MSRPADPTPRESRFVAILLFPLRSVERAGGRRGAGLLALYGLVVVLVVGGLWRQSQLAGLPDVGEPPDGAASRGPTRVPEGRDALPLYRRASERFRDMNAGEGEAFAEANLRWSAADATLRGWVADQAEAIALFREASGRPEVDVASAGGPGTRLEDAEGSQITTRLSWIGAAALFEAGRLRAGGDPAGSWALLKAVARASRHMERIAPTIQGHATAIILVQYAQGPVAEWAEDPSVGVDLLRKALGDLAAAESLTPPPSETYRAEYRAAMESLADSRSLLAERARRRSGSFDWFALAPGLETFLRREPERSRRVLRLLIANDLAWSDRPAFERPALAVPRLRIYEPNPAAPPASRALPPEILARWADSSLIPAAPPWRMGDVETWDRNDRWSMGRLKEAVAVALFAREEGHPPASPAEALRRYLPTEGDSPDRDEAEPRARPE